jgi:hypothetical protein
LVMGAQACICFKMHFVKPVHAQLLTPFISVSFAKQRLRHLFI